MGRKLLTLIITCSGCFYRNTLPPCTNNISFRICAISKHCFKVQRMTSLQAFSEACASSSSSTSMCLWFWNSRRKLQGRQLSLESLSPLGSQQLLLWSVKWMWASPQLMVALKQLEAQLYCAVLQLLGTTEHDGSAPLWLNICSPTANTRSVPLLRHLEVSVFLQAAPSALDTE